MNLCTGTPWGKQKRAGLKERGSCLSQYPQTHPLLTARAEKGNDSNFGGFNLWTLRDPFLQLPTHGTSNITPQTLYSLPGSCLSNISDWFLSPTDNCGSHLEGPCVCCSPPFSTKLVSLNPWSLSLVDTICHHSIFLIEKLRFGDINMPRFHHLLVRNGARAWTQRVWSKSLYRSTLPHPVVAPAHGDTQAFPCPITMVCWKMSISLLASECLLSAVICLGAVDFNQSPAHSVTRLTMVVPIRGRLLLMTISDKWINLIINLLPIWA